MRISVITAVHNRVATIGDALDSVRAQTWPDVQHVVIDGASLPRGLCRPTRRCTCAAR
jgi:glycosyltransferase involved in cell wall biosynthesis